MPAVVSSTVGSFGINDELGTLKWPLLAKKSRNFSRTSVLVRFNSTDTLSSSIAVGAHFLLSSIIHFDTLLQPSVGADLSALAGCSATLIKKHYMCLIRAISRNRMV